MKRDYLGLKELMQEIKAIETKQECCGDTRIMIGMVFLCDRLQDNNMEVTKNNVQTFFSNHYLREICQTERLKDKEYYIKTLISKDREELYRKSGWCQEISTKFAKEENMDDRNIDIIKKVINTIIESRKQKKEETDLSRLKIPSKKTLSELRENGYAIVENFITGDNLKKLCNITEKIRSFELTEGEAYLYGPNNKSQRIYNLISKNKIYQHLVTETYLTNICEMLFDRDTYHPKYGLSSMAANIIAPGGKQMPWHIDSVVPEPIPDWMIRFIAVINLSEFTAENGSTTCVPKSHKLRRRPTANDGAVCREEKILTAPKGSLIMWDGLLWHRTSENKTKNYRSSIIISYAASYFMEICGEEEHLSVIPNETLKEMPERLKQMVGYQRAIKKGAQKISHEIYNIDR
tara:strand:- start:1040 stop:2257 length:1218 start_codon:yes stop_codon:yes gene_type:complete